MMEKNGTMIAFHILCERMGRTSDLLAERDLTLYAITPIVARFDFFPGKISKLKEANQKNLEKAMEKALTDILPLELIILSAESVCDHFPLPFFTTRNLPFSTKPKMVGGDIDGRVESLAKVLFSGTFSKGQFDNYVAKFDTPAQNPSSLNGISKSCTIT